MGTVALNRPRTKKCPFCGERIRAQAIKCRFCAEFLDTKEAKQLEADSEHTEDEQAENILFEGRPSLLGMVGAAIKGLLFLGVAWFLLTYPLEELSLFQANENSASTRYEESADGWLRSDSELAGNSAEKTSWLALTERQVSLFRSYRIAAGLGLAVLVMLMLFMKVLKLKMTYYEVTSDRIEWSRGIFDRKVDNLDMFRVIDLKLRRSLLDCIFGIGTVELITTDKTDPEFAFEKMRYSRLLYDVVKKASLAADRRDGVIHLE
jgi:membrane protein YdbS with pleckstrin-like domain